jgi:hypothetical protein
MSAIDEYVRQRISAELTSRLTDQKGLVREIADDAEDVVWKRLKRYTIFGTALAAIVAGVLTWEGIKTIGDARQRIEPIVREAEQKAQATKRGVDETASTLDSVKSSLNSLAHDVQTQRVKTLGGGLAEKIGKLEESYRNVETMVGTLDHKVQRVSNQVDNASVSAAYPSLGQQRVVTYNSGVWNKPEKRPQDKWASIFIYPLCGGRGDSESGREIAFGNEECQLYTVFGPVWRWWPIL